MCKTSNDLSENEKYDDSVVNKIFMIILQAYY